MDKPSISAREEEILVLISNGLSSAEIADRLFISCHTVNTHRKNILRKLRTKSSFAAISMYLQEQIHVQRTVAMKIAS